MGGNQIRSTVKSIWEAFFEHYIESFSFHLLPVSAESLSLLREQSERKWCISCIWNFTWTQEILKHIKADSIVSDASRRRCIYSNELFPLGNLGTAVSNNDKLLKNNKRIALSSFLGPYHVRSTAWSDAVKLVNRVERVAWNYKITNTDNLHNFHQTLMEKLKIYNVIIAVYFYFGVYDILKISL